jgi:hypothetical protein
MKFMFRLSKTEGVDNNKTGIVNILLICGYELKIKCSVITSILDPDRVFHFFKIPKDWRWHSLM